MSPVFLAFAVIVGMIVAPAIIRSKLSAKARAAKEDAERTVSPARTTAATAEGEGEQRQPIRTTVAATVVAPRTEKTDCPCPEPVVPRGSMQQAHLPMEGMGTYPKKHLRQELAPSLKEPVLTNGTSTTTVELQLTQNELAKAVLYSEILGKPKALLP